MALVAIDAVVYVPTHSPVIRVCLGLGVAIRTSKDGVVAGVRVAGGTDALRVAVISREPRVIERGSCPCCSGVTRLARSWKSCRRVVWICRALIFGGMAGVAICWSSCKNVVYVATGTCNVHMSTGKGKWRVVVVERRSCPGCCRVTHGAILRETGRDVVRIVRTIKIRLVTGNAGG